MQVVTIVQRRLTHYRVPLFRQMSDRLHEEGIRLQLLHGEATQAELKKRDAGEIEWAEKLPTRYFLDGKICWQPFTSQATGTSLIIVTQENKLLNNLLTLASPKRPPIAFWGHGRNMQARQPNSILERFKRWTTRRVDWWFAYTDLSADFVCQDGFPPERITILNNSIDTTELREAVLAARHKPRQQLRSELKLGNGPVGLFMGSLYEDKRIPFLLEAARVVHAQVPSFELVIAGDGPLRPLVEVASRESPWIRYHGSVRGAAKAQLLATCDIVLNPGLVGLGILDGFVAGIPMITTDCRIHSPEIAYLQHGTNGLMTENSLQAFVDAAIVVANDTAYREKLAHGAREAGKEFSIEMMAQRFTGGILDALAFSARRATK